MAQFEGVDFPGWEVVRKIGEGSFGGVYEIHRTLPGGLVEKCALKKLTIPKDNGEIEELYSHSFGADSITAHYKNRMEELVNEYGIMQSLNNCPNTVTCYDIRYIQHDDGIGWDIYIRMELLFPLKKALGSIYSEDTVRNLGIQMCRALIACHQGNIIHRDIKPENIMVSDQDVFKLGDFGIAKISEKTASGTLTGSYGYMAPEVANRQHYGAGADIYSLGMVLYWMMNKRTLPFLPLPPSIPTGAQRQQAQERRLSGEPLPPPTHGSAELKAIVLKACAYAQEERFHSAREMYEALCHCSRIPVSQEQASAPAQPAPGNAQVPVAASPDAQISDEPTQYDTVGAFGNIPVKSEAVCSSKPAQVTAPAEGRKPKNSASRKNDFHKWLWLPACLLLLCGVFGIKQVMDASPASKYRAAQELLEAKDYSGAAEAFEALGDYSDSAEKAQEAQQMQEQEKKEHSYQTAQALMDTKDYSAAAKAFEALGDYADSVSKVQEARQMQEQVEKERSYQAAQTLMDDRNYSAAAEAFAALGNYADSASKVQEARQMLEQAEKEQSYRAAQALMDDRNYSAAAEAFAALGNYADSASKVQEARQMQTPVEKEQSYQAAQALMDDGKYMQAMWAFSVLDYGDSQEKMQEVRDSFIASQRILSLAAGANYTIGLRSDGTVVATGLNASDRCGVGDWTDIAAVSTGSFHTVGLRNDGTVVTRGSNASGQCNAGSWTDIAAVSTGSFHTVGLRGDGTVVAAGLNTSRQCNVGSWSDIVAVSAGNAHTVGLHSDGTVVAAGKNGYGQCKVHGWTNIVAVSAGDDYTVGLRSDGTVVAAGLNTSGQCDVGSWSDIVAVSAGNAHTVGLRSDGTVVAAGLNTSGQCDVGSWSDIVAVSAGNAHTVGLRSDGTVVAVGKNNYGQCDVSNWTNIATTR